MEYCVIFNPTAARGRADQKMAELRQLLGGRAEFRPTERPGHAEELAFQAASAGFPTVAAAGGDGTVHEVANGLLRAGKSDVAFAVFPMGSANDYAEALGIGNSFDPASWKEQGTRQVDVGLVRAEDGRQRYFVNTLGLGFSGSVTIEARKIRWLQGVALYGLAFLRALWAHYEIPMMTIQFDGEVRRTPTLSLTVALGKKEGALMVAPDASLDDGWFDYLHGGPLSRWKVFRYLPRLATGGRLPDDPALWQGRCREIQLQSEAPLTVHLDGEFLCKARDGLRSLHVQLLPGALRVMK
jgi:diacylglycerol kinase family enzyme